MGKRTHWADARATAGRGRAALVAAVLGAALTACVGPVLAAEHDLGAEDTTVAPAPVTERYIWCLVDAGSLGIPDPITACADIG
ncbi:MAG: hypothetical protein OEV40_22545 [Acidimicrobiia bacterium]|nr:hypothetical protein [Acidimicrobiia bacterium]